MRPQGSFIQPAGAMKWFWGLQRVKRVLLPMESIMSAVNAWPSAVAPMRPVRAKELFIVGIEKRGENKEEERREEADLLDER